VSTADRTLTVSHDEHTGMWFFPPRAVSVDGTLRELRTVEVPAVGTLTEAVEMGGRWYGYVDLDGDIRILTELGAAPHAVGQPYRLASGADETRRFDRA
jgi:hypothetical protein